MPRPLARPKLCKLLWLLHPSYSCQLLLSEVAGCCPLCVGCVRGCFKPLCARFQATSHSCVVVCGDGDDLTDPWLASATNKGAGLWVSEM